MKNLILLSVLITAFSFTGFTQNAEWTSYKSDDGHYSISFPGKPEITSELDTSSGIKLKINMAEYEKDEKTVFIASWIDLGKTAAAEKNIKDLV